MAKINVTEFRGIQSWYTNASAQVPVNPPAVAAYDIAVSGTSAPSSAFDANTNVIRVQADSICAIIIGPGTPVALATSTRMVAGQTEYFGVVPGHKIAAITTT